MLNYEVTVFDKMINNTIQILFKIIYFTTIVIKFEQGKSMV